MKKFLKTVWGKLCIAAAALVISAFAGLTAYTVWHYNLDKFKSSYVIELGSALPPVEELLTEAGSVKSARLLNEDGISLDKTGAYELILSHNGKEEALTLYIVDTTAPTAEFCEVNAEEGVSFNASDFVKESFDLSPVTAVFVTEPVYGDDVARVRVTDGSGNSIQGTCLIHYRLVFDNVSLELGDKLAKEDVLLTPEKYGGLLEESVLDAINASPVGEYTVNVKDEVCTVTVKDTVAPVLELRDVLAEQGSNISPALFTVKAEDASGSVKCEFVSAVSSKELGTFTVEIRASDVNGNSSVKTARLKVEYDITAPVITGITDITVPKKTEPDYKKGVSAKDARDGNVDYTVDTSKVDVLKAGTYYVTYTAKDSSGNVATKRRKVTVTHNAEDTAELVKEVASKLSGDVLELRNYVRNSIRYNSSWGGDDPVWYGFKNRVGNCYVHALCLDALLKSKGYETKLIWVTDKTHYWNIVKLDGKWRHIDSTPARQHMVFSNPMTDEERHSCLQGRDWDRTMWPECN